MRIGNAANGKNIPDNSQNADAAGERNTVVRNARRARGAATASGALQRSRQMVRPVLVIDIIDMVTDMAIITALAMAVITIIIDSIISHFWIMNLFVLLLLLLA